MKKFALEAIIQVARSLGTKFLVDTNENLSLRGLSIAFTKTDLKPFNNNPQHIRQRSSGVEVRIHKRK